MQAQATATPERREKGEYYVGWSPIGVHYATSYGPPVSVAKYLNGRWMVGVDLGVRLTREALRLDQSDNPSAFPAPWERDHCAHQEFRNGQFINLGTFARYMATRTLFVGAALHRRTWSGKTVIDYTGGCLNGSNESTGHLETQATVASAMLGNSWVLSEGFTITGTWLVLSSPLSKSSAFSLGSRQGISAADLRDVRETAKSMGDELTWRSTASGAAVLSIG